MQVNDLTSIDPNVDYTQILPIQQKRMIAFVNHFVMNTVSFLNKFAQSCESRLMEFEYKIQKVEASLLILEAQLASIPHLDEELPVVSPVSDNTVTEPDSASSPNVPSAQNDQEKAPDLSVDPIYQKFFKMVHVGAPAAAVKLQMKAEGLDPNVLDSCPSRPRNTM